MREYIFSLPFICGLLWLLGGRDVKLLRRLGVGLAVSIGCYLITHNLYSFTCVGTYALVTSLGYGKLIEEKQWFLLFLLGMSYGFASVPVAFITKTYHLLMLQAALAGFTWLFLVWWANNEYLSSRWRITWAYCEGITGLVATILVPYMLI